MGVSGLGHETTKGELLCVDIKMLLRDPSARWCHTWQRWRGATVHWTSSSAGGLSLTFTQPCERGISVPINRGDIGGSEGLCHLPKATELGRNRTGAHAPWSSFCNTSGTYKHLVGHRGKKGVDIIPRPFVCTTNDIMGKEGALGVQWPSPSEQRHALSLGLCAGPSSALRQGPARPTVPQSTVGSSL